MAFVCNQNSRQFDLVVDGLLDAFDKSGGLIFQGVKLGGFFLGGWRCTAVGHSHAHLQVVVSGFSLAAHSDLVESSSCLFVEFVEVSEGIVRGNECGKDCVGVEENRVLNDRSSRNSFPGGETGYSKHSTSSVADFDLSESLAGIGV